MFLVQNKRLKNLIFKQYFGYVRCLYKIEFITFLVSTIIVHFSEFEIMNYIVFLCMHLFYFIYDSIWC